MPQSRWANVPFAPRALPFFYGWVMVAGSVLATLASVPGQTMGVGVFTESLERAWQVSSVQLSFAYMIGTIISSFLLPYAGVLLDRHGARVSVAVSSLGLGIAMVLLAEVERLPLPPGVVTPYIVLALGAFSFMALRFFGQGCLTLCARYVIGQWFDRQRGFATAIAGAFASFGFSYSPVVINDLVAANGYRATLYVLALVVGGGMTAVGWLLYRDNPEECGLLPDGARAPEPGAALDAAAENDLPDLNRAQALKTLGFWAFSLALASHGLLITALTFLIAPLGAEAGLTRDEAFALFWPMAVFSVLANLGVGAIGNRADARVFLVTMMAMQALGTFALLYLDQGWARVLLAIGYGTAGGIFANLVTTVWPRFFGRMHLGAISGFNMSVLVFSSALGPLLFSSIESLAGSYRPALWGWFMVPATIATVGLFARNPRAAHEAAQRGTKP